MMYNNEKWCYKYKFINMHNALNPFKIKGNSDLEERNGTQCKTVKNFGTYFCQRD